MAIRPERADVTPTELGTDADAPNVIRGVIAMLLFVGDRFNARVELPWGDDILLHLPPDDRWREGQPVAIRLAPQDLHVWPASASPIDVEPSLEPDAPPSLASAA